MNMAGTNISGADGWERYRKGFAELAAIAREREMEPDGMSMSA